MNIGDKVTDKVDDLGEGQIIDIYTNRHDDSNGVTMYIVEFGFNGIFDRLAHEIE